MKVPEGTRPLFAFAVARPSGTDRGDTCALLRQVADDLEATYADYDLEDLKLEWWPDGDEPDDDGEFPMAATIFVYLSERRQRTPPAF